MVSAADSTVRDALLISFVIKLNRKRTEGTEEVRGPSGMQTARLEENSLTQSCRLWTHKRVIPGNLVDDTPG